jgi:hypothetical protein
MPVNYGSLKEILVHHIVKECASFNGLSPCLVEEDDKSTVHENVVSQMVSIIHVVCYPIK